MMKIFKKHEYDVPSTLMERFEYLTTKLDYAKKENFIELYRGYSIVFKIEFDKYKV